VGFEKATFIILNSGKKDRTKNHAASIEAFIKQKVEQYFV
jgi:hypothetical protein